MFSLGRQVAAIRILYGIKQEDLAKEIGVSRVQLSFFENDKVMLNADTTQRLLSFLKGKGVASLITLELPEPIAA